MRIAVTGSGGQLGGTLIPLLEERHEVFVWGRPTFDLTRPEIGCLIDDQHPDVVIHAAAMTNVDACETYPALAMAVNGEGTRRLAAACAKAGASLFYVSTDYVFDGAAGRAYREEDSPNPLNAYGRSKLAGEESVRSLVREHCIIRTAWLYSDRRRNFVRTVLGKAKSEGKLRVVTDQVGSPTYAPDLAAAIALLVERHARRTYHVVNSGEATWLEFARAIIGLAANGRVPVEPILAADLGLPAQRPAFSVLNAEKYQALAGGPLRPWQEALPECLARLEFASRGVRCG